MDSILKSGQTEIVHKNMEETFKYNDPLMNSTSTSLSSNPNNFYQNFPKPHPSPLIGSPILNSPIVGSPFQTFSDPQFSFIPPLYPPNLPSHSYTFRFMNNDMNSSLHNKDSKSKTNLKKKRPQKYNPRREGLTPNSAGNYRGKKLAEELLTDEQKKAHHIASEQKRRQNIRDGYDMLIASIPQLKHGPRNEAVVLEKALEYIIQLQSKQSELKNRVVQLQTNLGDTTDYFKDFVDLEIPEKTSVDINSLEMSESFIPGEENSGSFSADDNSAVDPNLA